VPQPAAQVEAPVAAAACVELVGVGTATVELVVAAFDGEPVLDVTTGDTVDDLGTVELVMAAFVELVAAALVVELVAAALVVELVAAALLAPALVATVAAPPARFPFSQWYSVGLKQALLQAW